MIYSFSPGGAEALSLIHVDYDPLATSVSIVH